MNTFRRHHSRSTHEHITRCNQCGKAVFTVTEEFARRSLTDAEMRHMSTAHELRAIRTHECEGS